MADEYLELLELQERMKEGVEGLFPHRLWVKAEISSVQLKANGHCYLDLSQNDGTGVVAKARAVIWRNRYFTISAALDKAGIPELKAGMTILADVQVSYSELYGLTLTIDGIEPQFTLGEAELNRRRTIAKLTEEGLMDRQKGLLLPDLPYALAVISASSAAGFGDFCRHLGGNEYGFVFKVDLFEATMQGQNAPGSVCDALDRIQNSGVHYDAVLIMRGGGSALDLACFDDYSMCFAIANCSIPVFTAIGHERDFHVVDMVAHTFVKTPTALADEFIGCYLAEDERLSSYSTRLRLAFAGKLSAMESILERYEARIRSANPRSILARGYSLVTDCNGVVLKKAAGISGGDTLKVIFADGSFDVKVIGKK